MKEKIIFIASTGTAFLTCLFFYKFLSSTNLDGSTILFIGPINFNISYKINDGINFGIAGVPTIARQITLALISVIISLFIARWSLKDGCLHHLFYSSLLCGGGISNAVERVTNGGVFDYLNVSLVFYTNPFSFNVADICIFSGLLGILTSRNS